MGGTFNGLSLKSVLEGQKCLSHGSNVSGESGTSKDATASAMTESLQRLYDSVEAETRWEGMKIAKGVAFEKLPPIANYASHNSLGHARTETTNYRQE